MRLQKYCLIRRNKPALEVDLTKFEVKKYVNPFDVPTWVNRAAPKNPFRQGTKGKDFIFKTKL